MELVPPISRLIIVNRKCCLLGDQRKRVDITGNGEPLPPIGSISVYYVEIVPAAIENGLRCLTPHRISGEQIIDGWADPPATGRIHNAPPYVSSFLDMPPDRISNSVPSGDISAGRGLETVVGIVVVSPPLAETWAMIRPHWQDLGK